ncbi:MAG: UDP-N-acetylmuramoyl-L-alanine--D-glutamate ligase [Gammaproteobacteria bacterium]|nr:UDP-N-acetylmuramoyl-L-alanine--D-glutamate ligase [Gammaproteobacteria bacterium]
MLRDKPQRALVVGLGLTGLSCARYLAARDYDVTVVDDREQPPMLGELTATLRHVDCHTGAWDPRLFGDPGLLVVSPGVSLGEPLIAKAIANGTPAIGDVELFAQAVTAPVLAVTGVNGKSTVTALLGEMCREAGLDTRVGGNIGVPILSLLESSSPDVHVVELSSFQLETTYSLNAFSATVLNLSRDHMDRYDSLERYAAAKARVFNGDGIMVLNRDDDAVLAMAISGRRQIRFGLGPPRGHEDFGLIEADGVEWFGNSGQVRVPVDCVPLQGRHNLANVLAAMALAHTMNVPADAMRRAISRFQGLPHRSQVVAEYAGVTWIDDSKATNVGATHAALTGETRPVVLIAGGQSKGANFRLLKDAVAAHTRAVVLIGRDAGLIESALEGVAPVTHVSNMIDAVTRANELAQSGDVVLLSPGCASFDMFDNYAHRGEVFASTVRDLTGNVKP